MQILKQRLPSHIRLLVDAMATELECIAHIQSELSSSNPEQLMEYSREAFGHMFREIMTIAENEEAGFSMPAAELFYHKVRRAKWHQLFENIWIEIDNRGQDVKRQLVTQAFDRIRCSRNN